MAMHGLKKRFNPVEVLALLEKDCESSFCVNDSPSEDEDLVHPNYTQDSGDSDYCLPSSESDEDDYDDEDYVPTPATDPRPLTSTLQSKAGGLLAPSPSERPGKRKLSLAESEKESEEEEEEEEEQKEKKKKRKKKKKKEENQKEKKRKKKEEEDDDDRWHDKEEEDIKPDPLRFMPARSPGPMINTTTTWSPISLFQLFFSTSVVRTIIENTNANAAKRNQAGVRFKWEALTVKDFYTFLATIIFTGLVSVHNRADYWRKKWPYNFPFPSRKMSRDRFEAILWSLHLSDPKEDEENEKKKNTPEYDRLFKIKPLYTDMVDACKAHFQPYRNLSIDERMVASKARISIKHYMKNKLTKWGYKLFVLADASTGYTCNFFVYTGKRQSPTGRSLSYSAVMDLLCFPILGSGYTLYTDNFYTSTTLFTDLSKKNIGCCGTIRTNNTGFPKTQTNNLPKNAERGDIRWMRSGKLLFVKWMDTREVKMCSTVHQAYNGLTVLRKAKEAGVWKNKSIPVPDCIVDYNRNMGGVDLSDALIGSYSVHQKTKKWYKTFFYHFVDVAAVNSYLLHKELFKVRQDPTQTKPFTHKKFREVLAKQMLEFADGSEATPPPTSPTTCMPVFFDNRETRARKHCKRCLNAGTPRVKTAVYCRRCLVPLCLTSKKNCFQLWHDGQ
ncbi:piggyBac transposable element-derived protein 4-like [Epinephelus fuscoguttatus]|uniref:piggyBac transposable element-derived protein 4-like n=1 Tax=Epinephelus fuscoguttatus TaxID=293821 RepID=UPI0020D0CD56|nr:piggyBac transposable element-derived protein 4-like [Epinephelus fuscoguttatus]